MQLHEGGGHWGRDALKITLTDKYYSLKLDIFVMKAIQACAKCKNFSAPRLRRPKANLGQTTTLGDSEREGRIGPD